MAVKSKSKSRKPNAKKASRGRRSAGARLHARSTPKKGASKQAKGARGSSRRGASNKSGKQQALQRARAQAKERARKEKERQQAQQLRERQAAAKERERAAALKQKEKDRERLRKEKERQQAQKLRERQAATKERERELARKKREHEILLKEKEKERARIQKEREAQKIAAQKAREAEKARLKAEREAERLRVKQEREAERERVREEARRKKEEERAKREAEREAYRKAKEAEQARLRAEKEAARRALEGRVVRATRASRAAQGGRLATTTRVYTPSSIPDQSGTRRSTDTAQDTRFANLRVQPPTPPSDGAGTAGRVIPRTLPPPPPPPPPATVEERLARINERLAMTDEAFRREYEESFLMSWIYHDSALEGVVYTYDELRMAINPNISVVPDSSLQTVCDEIRRHKAAIEFVKEQAEKKRVPITIDTLKRIYLILHPEEGDLKTVKYRKDIPQHRLYFHEYAAPDKIAYKVRQIFDWLNGPEPKKIKNPIRIAARAHYDLVRVFPFANDSGKAARLFMNLLLMRADCPPAIVHSTERQRYYEALRGQLPVIIAMVTEAITNALASIEKKLDERDTKLHTFA